MHLQMLARQAYFPTGDSDPVAYYHLPLVGRLYRKRIARCIDLLPRGRRVLEAGYGSGVSFLNLAEKFDEIHGLDLHNHPHEVARSFHGTGLTLHLRQGDILNLPYEDNSFDAALAVSIHEHLQPDQQHVAFAQIHRVLRPGGCYVVGVPGLNPMMTAAFYALGHNIRRSHHTSETQVLHAMADCFDLDTTQFTPWFLPHSLTTYVCARAFKR